MSIYLILLAIRLGLAVGTDPKTAPPEALAINLRGDLIRIIGEMELFCLGYHSI